MPVDYRQIGKNIQTKRKQMHITQEKMAEDLFLSTSLISKMERGVKPASLDTYASIAAYLGIDLPTIFSDPDKPQVFHQKIIHDIHAILDDMDNPHLQIVYDLLKTYAAKIAEMNYASAAGPSGERPS